MTNEQEKYLKARNDLIKALHSIGDLTEQQREQLAKEMFGVGAALQIKALLQNFRR